MAQNNLKVLLGFQDEFIVDKHNGIVNFAINKIGGNPDWPTKNDIKISPCPLCQLPRPLVLQIYAPLDNSSYHRTLYLFACINPNCWNQSESWLCLRSQVLEQNSDVANVSSQLTNNTLSVTDWCQDADDWDDNNANLNEENGNSINQIVQDHPSDDEEESCSFEEVIRSGLAHMTVDERNANIGAIVAEMQGGGAVGRQNSPIASAEIEVDESEIVTIDTPTAPQNDIAALLQEVTPLPQELCQRAQIEGVNASILQFVPSFISVGEEITGDNISSGSMISDHHIRDLLQEYQQNNEDADNLLNVGPASVAQNDLATLENYEKSVPVHGDKMFHHFLTRIQMNPGQILRYSRSGVSPLLMSPLQEIPRKCKNCQGEMAFELQILPTLIPKLRLQGADESSGSRIEFGTVLVYTCNRSCWSSDSKVREEEVVVQSENY